MDKHLPDKAVRKNWADMEIDPAQNGILMKCQSALGDYLSRFVFIELVRNMVR
jgi:hypothetical protein